jgi:DNA-binding MarR family transcriptional regulator
MDSLEEKARALTDLFTQLMRRFQMQESEFFRSLESELSLQELKVIFFLNRGQPSIMREIADCLNLSVSTMTRLIDRLVSKDLVTRRRPEDDRRIVNVELTAKGREVTNWQDQKHMQLCRVILRALSETDQQQLLDLLHRVIENDRAIQTETHKH